MMRLRMIVEADFRKSERTNYEEFEKKNKDLATQLGPHDVIAIVSTSRSQIVFLHGFDEVETQEGAKRKVLSSSRLRIIDGVWNPYMIVNYAKQAGINLTGLRMFEDHFGYLINGKPVSSPGRLRAVS